MESGLLKLQVNDGDSKKEELICNEFHPELLFFIFQMNCSSCSSGRFDLKCLQAEGPRSWTETLEILNNII